MSATILVADDSATMRMIVQSALAEAGWRVLAAADGGAALSLAGREPVGLVVSDWNMPGMGGLELIRALRASERYADVPILVLSTEDDARDKDAARGLGVSGWLLKPVDPSVLVGMAAECLDAGRAYA